MDPQISPGIIIPICTWAAIVLFITPFILSCCIKYCKTHPQSKITKCINAPLFLTKTCINATFKHKKYVMNEGTIHVNTHTQQDVETGNITTRTIAETSTTTNPETIENISNTPTLETDKYLQDIPEIPETPVDIVIENFESNTEQGYESKL
ncbi:hypothetical protein LOD99_3753 [Oopsacas minuta]|uniref:Uncharacterized protein n=1 Tax=Oopsacas minuta TaxID=111878 RepID=A0AAV7JWU8_9METZ|nr:hypothetical protein LOD99_3753 [Oopsacas minuta]